MEKNAPAREEPMTEPFHRQQHYHRITALLDRIHGQIIPHGANYGQISRTEAEFLLNCVLDERPRHIVELGTAAGVSTAYMLCALNMLDMPDVSDTPNVPDISDVSDVSDMSDMSGTPDIPDTAGTGTSGRHLTAIEYLDHCYFDPARTPGFIVDEVFPRHPPGFSLHLNTSGFDLQSLTQGRPIDMLFIDANHTHPWATLDTILALPFLAPNATIVYHDINLHHRGGAAKVHDKGPHTLFYHLPAAQKAVVGEFPYPNIGSLRLVTPQRETLENLLGILFRFPWEPQAWPVLDAPTLQRFGDYVEHHWGPDAARSFRQGLNSLEPAKVAAS